MRLTTALGLATALLGAPTLAQAADFSLKTKGMIAVDILEYSRNKMAGNSEETLSSGIGTLDLKVDVRSGDTHFRVKLDLDNSHPETAYNLFEEAYMDWSIVPDFNVMVGKGVVPFHRRPLWAVISPSYFDGGSSVEFDGRMRGSLWSFTDQDKRYLMSLTYGEYKAPLRNYFTVYGLPGRARLHRDSLDDNDKPVASNYGSYKFEYNAKIFDPRDQRGFANRFEYELIKDLVIGVSGLTYWHHLYPESSWAVEADASYANDSIEIWFETLYGKSADVGLNENSFKDKRESVTQLGGSYRVLDDVLLAADVEFANVSYKKLSDNTEIEGATYKLESGVIYEINRNAKWTSGFMVERFDQKGAELIDNLSLSTGASFFF